MSELALISGCDFIDASEKLQIQQDDQNGVQKGDAVDRDTDWPQFVPFFRDFRLVPFKKK